MLPLEANSMSVGPDVADILLGQIRRMVEEDAPIGDVRIGRKAPRSARGATKSGIRADERSL